MYLLGVFGSNTSDFIKRILVIKDLYRNSIVKQAVTKIGDNFLVMVNDRFRIILHTTGRNFQVFKLGQDIRIELFEFIIIKLQSIRPGCHLSLFRLVIFDLLI